MYILLVLLKGSGNTALWKICGNICTHKIFSLLLSLFHVPYNNLKPVQLLQVISNHHLFSPISIKWLFKIVIMKWFKKLLRAGLAQNCCAQEKWSLPWHQKQEWDQDVQKWSDTMCKIYASHRPHLIDWLYWQSKIHSHMYKLYSCPHIFLLICLWEGIPEIEDYTSTGLWI